MKDLGFRKPSCDVGLEPFPWPFVAGLVAAASQHSDPVSSHLITESDQAVIVSWDGVIVEPSLNDTAKPFPLYMEGGVHHLVEFLLDVPQFGAHPFGHRSSGDFERPSASPSATVSKTQKVKCLWATVPASLAVLSGKSSEFNESCLFRVEFQSELL